jgi:hypothetical protein
MRHSLFVACLGVLAACESSDKVSPTTLVWMDWPAEVNAKEPFRTRLVTWGICASNPRFYSGASANAEAVTFSPYYLVDDNTVYCATAREALIVVAIDTAGTAPGLSALVSRTYEMRGTVTGYIRDNSIAGYVPVWTFGEVHVVPEGANPSRRKAAGTVTLQRDTLACARITPTGLYDPAGGLVLENQADTTGLAYAFVRGYVYDAPSPVCGETRVFHLESVN